jgi:hypothetical protein
VVADVGFEMVSELSLNIVIVVLCGVGGMCGGGSMKEKGTLESARRGMF